MPRIKRKHLSRAQFEFLLDHMMNTLPDHEITEWLQWVWSMNEGDSNIRAGSEQGYRMMQYDKAEFDERMKNATGTHGRMTTRYGRSYIIWRL